MRGTRLAAITLGVLGVLVSALIGMGEDDLGLAGPGEPLKLTLLRLPAVQKELGMTPEQQAKVNTLSEETKEAKKQIEAASGKGKEKAKQTGPSRDGLGFNPEALAAGLSDLEQQAEKALGKLLDAKQRTRLAQIALRAEGPSAFVRPELIKALNLGEDQIAVVQDILDGQRGANDQYKESLKQAFELTKGLGDNPELEKLRKDQQKGMLRTRAYSTSKQAMAQIAKILTRRQRENYNKLLGPPFEFSKLADAKGQPLFGNAPDLATTLLRQPAVRDELKLTDQQKAQLDRGDSPSRVLDTRQSARLNQLAVQSEGPSAFARPDVQKMLRLNEAQIDDINALLEDVRSASQQLHESQKGAAERRRSEGGPIDPAQEKERKEQEKEQLRFAATGLRRRVMDQINRLLTRTQKETFTKMLGAPFDFARMKREPPKKDSADESAPIAKGAS
jgi:hypothetical protein